MDCPGCPARAGIGPAQATPVASRFRLPRASGDRPLLDMQGNALTAVAPRERG